MPDTTFTPINAAVRRITGDEGGLLRDFLGSDLTLDEFISDIGQDPEAAQKALTETGLTLPEQGLGNRFTPQDLQLYTDILEGSQDFFSASQTFGFDPEAGVQSLQESGLRVPLQPSNRRLFDTATSLGLSSTDLSGQLGLEQNVVDFTLGAAGLNLPDRAGPFTASTGSGTDRGGASGTSFLDNAFSGVPQAPGVKLGFLKNIGRKRDNPNIISGPRGVTTSAAIRRNKLAAGSV